jgi:class 3 adenylate cyclase
MAVCERCHTESADTFRFCPECGAPLPERAAPRQSRKVVTALFCDVTGSTALGEELDPEVLRGVMNRYFADIRATIERHGGTVEKFIGDAVMAVFGMPRVEEDDALRAVRAAAEIRDRLPAIAAEAGVALRFRTGVNTGAVLIGEGENLAIGDAVNVAARLEQAAAPGEIVLGSETLRLVRDAVEVEELEPLALKGKSEPVAAFRLLSVDPAAPGVARRLDVPLVGRGRELALLRQAWQRTVEEQGCHLFTLMGPAGVGKSRLTAELLEDIGDDATVLRGRCLHYGEGITFWPLVEALMPVGERAALVLEHLSAGGAATPDELFWEVRRLFESLAVERPLIVFIDDLQWAEAMLLDLLDHVVDLSRGTPILILCTARQELLEERPGWGGGKLNATAVLLQPLGAADADALLDQLDDRLDAEARARVVAASEGNPLFLEEMVALAHERGTVEVPATIQALLAARLERLGAEERELLERGAVEGEVFHRLAVRALAGERLAAEVGSRLAGLVRKELIRPHPATLQGDAFRFRHLLIRDAAYDGLPKATRAELHERFALWLEEHATGLVELDEIAGWHLEQAVHYTRELGRPAEPAMARAAAEHLHAAGRRASMRNDQAARGLLERALSLSRDDASRHALVAIDLAEELMDFADLAEVDELLTVAERDPDAAGAAELIRLEWLLRAKPHDAMQTAEARLPETLERLTRVGDERGLAKAHLAVGWVHWLAAKADLAAEQARLAAAHARRAGDDGLQARALALSLSPLVMGAHPAQGMAAELERIRSEVPGPYLAVATQFASSEVARCEGKLDDARKIVERSREDYVALGMQTMESSCMMTLARIELSDGNPGAARDALIEADVLAAKFGERSLRSTVQAQLADVESRLGNREASEAALDLVDELGAPEDMINFAIAYPARARLALAEGDGEGAERWARSGVDHAYLTDFPIIRGDARLNLARTLLALGRREEAGTEARAALALYEGKGDRPGAAETRAVLAELGDEA